MAQVLCSIIKDSPFLSSFKKFYLFLGELPKLMLMLLESVSEPDLINIAVELYFYKIYSLPTKDLFRDW